MGVMASMTALRNYLVASNLTGIDANNCVISDEGVFNNLLLRDDEEERRAIIIDYDGFKKRESSEFGGTLLSWFVTLTVFILLWGDIDERTAQIISGYELVDEILDALNNDSSLGGQVLDIVISQADSPMLYDRQQMNNYMMLSMTCDIRENID